MSEHYEERPPKSGEFQEPPMGWVTKLLLKI
jgi:hypothetical protein